MRELRGVVVFMLCLVEFCVQKIQTDHINQQPASRHACHRPAPLRVRLVTLLTVTLPLAGLVLAMSMLWHVAFDWTFLALFGGMYVITTFGITVGFHRLFTHYSFKTSWPMKLFFGIAGSMAFQGPLISWVATHRRHHQFSDSHGDPHSPHLHGDGILGTLRGFIHAHVGWMFMDDARIEGRYAADLRKDKLVLGVSQLFVLWAVLGLVIPAIIACAITGTWQAAVLGFIWGGLVRVFFGHHITWSINSVCHLWGTRPFASHDESRNNPLFGVLAFGEGWHNNHHAFPTSARHGLRWWQFDLSYLVIRTMGLLGLAYDIRVPAYARIIAKSNRLRRRAVDRA